MLYGKAIGNILVPFSDRVAWVVKIKLHKMLVVTVLISQWIWMSCWNIWVFTLYPVHWAQSTNQVCSLVFPVITDFCFWIVILNVHCVFIVISRRQQQYGNQNKSELLLWENSSWLFLNFYLSVIHALLK